MTAYARPFRLHHTGGVVAGAVFPSGHAIVVDDPEFGFGSTAPTLEQLLLGYHRARVEWPGESEQASPVDWQAIVQEQERALKAAGKRAQDRLDRIDDLTARRNALREQLAVQEAETMRQHERAEQAEAALVRVHHVAAAIHAGAPWTANHGETAARIRKAIAGPGTATVEETAARILFDENVRRHQATITRVDWQSVAERKDRVLEAAGEEINRLNVIYEETKRRHEGTITRVDELLAALARVHALAERWRYTGDRKEGPLRELRQALGEQPTPTPAATGATEQEKTARVFAALHRSAEDTVTRVIALYEQWVKAGPAPLGTSMARWWDARLAELHDAILPPPREQRERPTHTDGTPYRYHEIKAEGWSYCEGCRMWSTGVPDPHQCADTEMVACPSCLGAPTIPRAQLVDHNARHHPHHQEQP